jgi:hypothetical protein
LARAAMEAVKPRAALVQPVVPKQVRPRPAAAARACLLTVGVAQTVQRAAARIAMLARAHLAAE